MDVTNNPNADALPVYSFRGLLFKSERRFTLLPEGLLVEMGCRRVLVAYSDIASAKLYQVASTGGGAIDRCDLETRGRSIRLQSMHLAGPASLRESIRISGGRPPWPHQFQPASATPNH
jgi:hypothetical protein